MKNLERQFAQLLLSISRNGRSPKVCELGAKQVFFGFGKLVNLQGVRAVILRQGQTFGGLRVAGSLST